MGGTGSSKILREEFNQASEDNSDPDPPPSYSAVCTEKSVSDAENAERLRRFLLCCLAKDYCSGFCSSKKFCKDDWIHFIRLSKLCYEACIKKYPDSATILVDWTDDDCNSAEVEEQLLQPSRVLGIPTYVTVAMMRWAVSCTRWVIPGMYSCINELKSRNGFHVLAQKLATDRDLLFDRLIPPSDLDLRRHMEDGLERVCNQFFEYVHSATDYKIKWPEYPDFIATGYGTNPFGRIYFSEASNGMMFSHSSSEKATLQREYAVVSYLWEAMQGFPQDPKPGWWKRGPVKLWAKSHERRLFGTSMYARSC